MIMLSASANKQSRLKEQAEQSAALIMEESNPEKLGYIEVCPVQLEKSRSHAIRAGAGIRVDREDRTFDLRHGDISTQHVSAHRRDCSSAPHNRPVCAASTKPLASKQLLNSATCANFRMNQGGSPSYSNLPQSLDPDLDQFQDFYRQTPLLNQNVCQSTLHPHIGYPFLSPEEALPGPNMFEGLTDQELDEVIRSLQDPSH